MSAARYCKKFYPAARVCLFEASNRLGGRCGSYFDKQLNVWLDYSVHAVLKANSEAKKLWGNKVYHSPCFLDFDSGKITGAFKNIPSVGLAMFNTPFGLISKDALKATALKLWAFWNAGKVFFSQNDLQHTLVSPQFQYVDEIYYNHKLCAIEAKIDRAQKLVFQHRAVTLSENDVVICALDNLNACKILDIPKLKHSAIINIHYLTSTEITLPRQLPFIGVVGNTQVQWISVHGNVLSVTISHADICFSDSETLARDVWRDVCKIRGVCAAFVPPHRVFKFPRATLLMDDDNIMLRPHNALSSFKNVFLAGDWTMHYLPCSIETAALSGKRAAKVAMQYLKKK